MGGNMRLRNRKTGDIIESYIIETASAIGSGLILQDNDTNKHYQYNSLSELNDDWESYEEPKEYWYVSCDGRALKATTDEDDYNETHNTGHKQIGNYFETKEEAELALRRLKAWKRLKDNGFKFHGWKNGKTEYPDCVLFSGDSYHGDEKDLDLLFGGENE